MVLMILSDDKAFYQPEMNRTMKQTVDQMWETIRAH